MRLGARREYMKAYNRESREEKKRLGICVNCKEPSRPSRTLCQSCADKAATCPAFRSTQENRRKWVEYRRAIQAKGLCVQCLKPRENDGTLWRCCWCAATHRKSMRKKPATQGTAVLR